MSELTPEQQANIVTSAAEQARTQAMEAWKAWDDHCEAEGLDSFKTLQGLVNQMRVDPNPLVRLAGDMAEVGICHTCLSMTDLVEEEE